MSGFDCIVCKKQLDLYTDMPIYHDDCGHYACAHTCSDGSSDTCQVCSTKGLEKDKTRDVGVVIERYEPQKVEVKKEGWGDGLFSWANDLSKGLRNRNETVESCKDPFWLVGQRVPIGTLLEKGLHLNNLVQKGITMDQFLKAGYNIKELAKFPEVTAKKADDAVFPGGVLVLLALKTKPHHLRDYSAQLPIKDVCEITGLTKRHIVENMKLGFHPKYGIFNEGDKKKNWTIQDLRYLGFSTMKNFINQLGLRKLSHWYALNPTPVDLKLLEVTQEQVNSLISDVTQPQYTSTINDADNNNNQQYRTDDSRDSARKKYVVRISSDGQAERRELRKESKSPTKFKPRAIVRVKNY